MGLDKNIGFIGAGNMAGAIIAGLIDASAASTEQIFAADPDAKRLAALEQDPGIRTSRKNSEVAGWADVLILATKPQTFEVMLPDIAKAIQADTLVISIAAGIPTSTIEAALPSNTRVVRTMPNTPALVGSGATAIAPGTHATPDDTKLIEALFGTVGITVHVTEDLLDAVTGLSGSGPAYVFKMIEALTDGGQSVGLSEDAALQLTVQTVLGAATLLLEQGESPATLRERVTSPGGTTVAGLRALDEKGFSEALIEAVQAATRRSKELGEG